MVRLFFAVILIAPAVVMALNCKEPRLKPFLSMDYKAFDQSPPDGGWRALEGKVGEQELAEMLDGYRGCREGLTSEQKATLVFHAGQMLANIGQNKSAIQHMSEAYNKVLEKKYHWNKFVAGSIAFLNRDQKKLKEARDQVLAAEPDHPYVTTLNDLIRCFEHPYKDFDKCRNEPNPATQPNPAVK